MQADWYAALVQRLEVESELSGGDVQADVDIWKTIERRIQIAEYQPQAGPNVIVRELEDRKGAYFVLKNIKEKTYLRLSLTEHKMWALIDGQTTVEELIVEHYMETGEFAHNLVVRLVEQLLHHRMLVDEPIFAWKRLDQAVYQRSWLYRLSAPARFILTRGISINGLDGPIEKLYKYGGWLCFTWVAKVIFLLVSILGFVAYMLILNDPNRKLFEDNLIRGLATVWLLAIPLALIHELGHALTVKHYGREVPRGGVMLIMGLPAAFVETTDIWLEPRRARLMVTWNGPYTALIIAGLAALVINFFPTAPVNSLLFTLAAFAYTLVLWNFNPMGKFDGYHLLTDALNIRSLREKSQAFLWRGLREKILQRKRLTRQEWLFSIYGVLSVIWLVYVVYFVNSLVRILFRSLPPGPIIFRLLRYSMMAAVISFVFLIVLGVLQFVRLQISRYISSGGLRQHGRMALIGGVAALGIGIGLPLLFPRYALPVSAVLGLSLALAAAVRLSIFNRPYWGAARGLAHLSFVAALALLGFSQGARLFPQIAQIGIWMQWAGISALLLGGILLVWHPVARLGYQPLVLGLLAGVLWLISLHFVGGISFDEPGLYLLGAILMVLVWDLIGLKGSARVPAVALLYLGGLAIGLSWFYTPPIVDLQLAGTLSLVAGALHLVYARLPELSRSKAAGIYSQTQKAIGVSVANIVRRVIAQVYFESGWPGITLLGKDFSDAMQELGVALSIEVNQFRDQELPKRSAAELTEVYGMAFDELYRLVCRELGNEMSTLAFGYGIDLVPWQNREIVVEVILSRRTWGRALNKELMDVQDKRCKLLKRVPLFVSCSTEELDVVAAALQRERFARSEVILRQGDPGDKFYIIEHGKVTVWQTDDEGIERKVDELGAGQYFGEVALVSQAPRNATVRAETPLVLFSLGQEEFDRLVRQYVDLAQNVNQSVKHSWILRGMPIFDGLDGYELDQLAGQLKPETYQAGQVLFHEGDPGDRFYIVESGQLVVTRSVNGKTVELSRRGSGDYLGEIALLQNCPRTATITCATECALLSLEAEYFQALISKSMQVSELVSRTVSRRSTYIQMTDRRTNQSIGQPEA
jgi:putative peptide zinc metalloprotease protein